MSTNIDCDGRFGASVHCPEPGPGSSNNALMHHNNNNSHLWLNMFLLKDDTVFLGSVSKLISILTSMYECDKESKQKQIQHKWYINIIRSVFYLPT